MASQTGGIVDRSSAVIGTASVAAAAANIGRQFLIIQNTSAVNLAVRFGAAAAIATGAAAGSFVLTPGASLEFIGETFVPAGSVNVIAASGSGNTVLIWEG